MDTAPELHQGDRTDDWGRFLKSRYKKELGELSRLYPHKRSLFIDYRQIERFGKAGITLADELLVNPGKVLEDVWEAIKNNQLIRTKDG
ncbi:MAG TPA: AAA family ATPase, partial [Methanoregula sp.]|nr:AAA family ATPase [Methanoregula sp.]